MFDMLATQHGQCSRCAFLDEIRHDGQLHRRHLLVRRFLPDCQWLGMEFSFPVAARTVPQSQHYIVFRDPTGRDNINWISVVCSPPLFSHTRLRMKCHFHSLFQQRFSSILHNTSISLRIQIYLPFLFLYYLLCIYIYIFNRTLCARM